MGGTIRRYPDMDEYQINNAKHYEMRRKIELEAEEERRLADIERFKKNDSILLNDDYDKYCYLLNNPTNDIFATIEIDGKPRNRMALQHNLMEMYKPVKDQYLLTDQEYRQMKAREDLLESMRRDHRD